MLYAILAYHVEAEVMSWTAQEDAAVMNDLDMVHDRLTQHTHLGPAARLGSTEKARTLRGPGAGFVVDGPFAETKEQIAGYFVVEVNDLDEAVEIASLIPAAHHGTIEVRPVWET